MDPIYVYPRWRRPFVQTFVGLCLLVAMGGAAVTPPLSSAVSNATAQASVTPIPSTSVASPSPTPIVIISPCSSAYCRNNGVCKDAGGYAMCDCQPGFYGNRCDAAALSYLFTVQLTTATFGQQTLQSDAAYFSSNLNNVQSSLAVAMTAFLSNLTRDALWSEKAYVRTIVRDYRVASSVITVRQAIEFQENLDMNGVTTRLVNLIKKNIAGGSWTSPSEPLSITMDMNTVSVTDYNECSAPAAGYCDSNAECTNTQGSYQCRCKSGYKGSGYTCGIDNDAIKAEELKTIYIWGGIVGVVLLWMFTLACCLHRRKAKRIKKAKQREIIEEEVGQEAGIYSNSKGNLLHEKNGNSLGIITEGKRHSFSSEGSFDQRSTSSPSLSDARRGGPGLQRHGDRRASSGYYSDGGAHHPHGGRSSSQSVLHVPNDHRRTSRLSVDEHPRRVSTSQIPDGRQHPSLGRMASDGAGGRKHSRSDMQGRRESSHSNGGFHPPAGHRRSASSGMMPIDEQRRLSASHGGQYDPRRDSISSSGSRQFGNHLDVPRGRGPTRRPSSQPEMPQSRKSLGDIYEDRPASSHSHGGRSSHYKSQHMHLPPAKERRHTVSHMDDYDIDPVYPQQPNSMPLHMYGSQPEFIGRMQHMGGIQPLNVNNLQHSSPVPMPDY